VSHIAHAAIWVRDLELMRAFYSEAFGGSSGDLYENPSTGFKSYFISFGEGARLELMSSRDAGPPPLHPCEARAGYAHVALALGTREEVDTKISALRRSGVTVVSEPRVTGDGYYEAVVLDPEGNRLEITV
jgi:lactoylglutathione lyase